MRAFVLAGGLGTRLQPRFGGITGYAGRRAKDHGDSGIALAIKQIVDVANGVGAVG